MSGKPPPPTVSDKPPHSRVWETNHHILGLGDKPPPPPTVSVPTTTSYGVSTKNHHILGFTDQTPHSRVFRPNTTPRVLETNTHLTGLRDKPTTQTVPTSMYRASVCTQTCQDCSTRLSPFFDIFLTFIRHTTLLTTMLRVHRGGVQGSGARG